MKISIYTLGCKLNQAEEDALKEKLANAGFVIIPFGQKANLIIINCCSVTQTAVRKSRQIINQAKKLGEVWLTGCWSEKINGVKKIIPDKNKLYFEIIKSYKPNKLPQSFNQKRTRAFIKIENGCDNFCTYCVVPYFRGKPKSISPNQIIKQILEKEKQGFQELVLTGININKYHYKNFNLVDLTKKILKETSIPRIRFTSIDPSLVNLKFINLFKFKRVMPHVHLSLQNGSDRILKLMNRKYTTDEYINIVKKLKKINPQISFTTDIIVGFPCETDEDFQKTCQFVKKVGFLKIHVFPYSPRPKTSATRMSYNVSNKTKKERAEKLRKLSDHLQKKFREGQIGQKAEVLFEGKKNGFWLGFTPNYVKIRFKSTKILRNKLKMIKLKPSNLAITQ